MREAATREIGTREEEIAAATRRLFIIPESSVKDAAELIERMKRDLSAVRTRLDAIHAEERQAAEADGGRVSEALALVDVLPDLLGLADEEKLRDALRSLVVRVSFTVRRTEHERSGTGRPFYELGRVDVTLAPTISALLGAVIDTTGSRADSRGRG